jgi:hypothetical protein
MPLSPCPLEPPVLGIFPGLPGLPGARDGGSSRLRDVRGLPGSPTAPLVADVPGTAEPVGATLRERLDALCDGLWGLELCGAVAPDDGGAELGVCAEAAATVRMASGSNAQLLTRVDMSIPLLSAARRQQLIMPPAY